jgi:hypothetical protein
MNYHMYYVFIIARVIRCMTPCFVHIFISDLFPSMWAYGHYFFIEDANDEHLTQYYGVKDEFDQSSCASHHDQNLIEGRLGCAGKI